MTAAELYEIVKDVPREAWPAKTELVGRLWHCDTLPVPLANIINMFVGSMTAWLAGRNIEIKRQSHENSEMRFTVKVCNGWDDVVSVHIELVAALAAACKEAA